MRVVQQQFCICVIHLQHLLSMSFVLVSFVARRQSFVRGSSPQSFVHCRCFQTMHQRYDRNLMYDDASDLQQQLEEKRRRMNRLRRLTLRQRSLSTAAVGSPGSPGSGASPCGSPGGSPTRRRVAAGESTLQERVQLLCKQLSDNVASDVTPPRTLSPIASESRDLSQAAAAQTDERTTSPSPLLQTTPTQSPTPQPPPDKDDSKCSRLTRLHEQHAVTEERPPSPVDQESVV